ncbi:cupin domain-containing protein [Vibrio campbellii]|jgi:quercetin dioxygenase-like cupin family protein|uniref:cupin domain-containing protein n=1 Tax=Vibrio campbellii TaxID=680 RepID=UPI001F4399A6|nr:cupin domain-containing protein [Vibrio campbellii]MCE7733169.1 cupin domain-containing protein [Vibrio campbellii]
MNHKFHQEKAPTQPIGETELNIGSIELADVAFLKNIDVNRLKLALNEVRIAPNGVVPLHSHNERPAIMFVVQGEITEYNSNVNEPKKHKAPSVAVEFNDVEHWWKNEGDEEVVIYSAMLV